MTALHFSRLDCDICGKSLTWAFTVSGTGMRTVGKTKGWRRDKLGRDICEDHPRLNERGRRPAPATTEENRS